MKTQNLKGVDILNSLEARQQQVHSRAVQMRNFKVVAEGQFEVDGINLYVPGSDPHPLRQLCSIIGMSYGFYKANPSALNTQIFATRLAALAEQDKADKGERIIRYRTVEQGRNRLLAILPMAHQTMPYAETMRPILTSMPDNTVIRLANDDQVDDFHRFTLRASFPSMAFEAADRDPIEMGLYLDMSEDGLGPRMTMTGMLQRLVCSNGAMETFNESPYFEYNYRGIRPMDLGAALTSAVDRFGQDLSLLQARCQESTRALMSKDEASAFLKQLEENRQVSSGFIRKIRKDIEAQDLHRISRWTIVNEITQRAQGLPYSQRVQHEFAAGRLLGLNVQDDA